MTLLINGQKVGQKDKGKMQDYIRVPWLIGFFTLTLVTIDTLKLVGWLVCECQKVW